MKKIKQVGAARQRANKPGIKYKEQQVLLLVKKKARRTLSADGNRRVPKVNRNSDGDWNFNLHNFDGDWNDNYCLLCFCDSFAFSRFIFLAGFFLQIFLPAT